MAMQIAGTAAVVFLAAYLSAYLFAGMNKLGYKEPEWAQVIMGLALLVAPVTFFFSILWEIWG